MLKRVYIYELSQYNIADFCKPYGYGKEKPMPKYKKCPRCELNYIPVEKEYCSICEAELKGQLFDYDIDEDEEEGLCPRCRVNYVNEGEKYCEQCLAEIEAEKEKSHTSEFAWDEPEDDGSNEDFDDDLIDDDLLVHDSLDAIGEEEDEEDDDEEEQEQDYFEDDIEDIGDIGEEDDDDEDDEEDEEDDED